MAKIREVKEKRTKRPREAKSKASESKESRKRSSKESSERKKRVNMKDVTFSAENLLEQIGLGDHDAVSAAELIAHIRQYASKKGAK